MSGHTLGPWWSEGGKEGERIQIMAGGHEADLGGVAETYSPVNARLIAAAPALLEALEMVRDADDDVIRDGYVDRIPTMARQKIDAAIAKARGAK